jgi:hypothetical protein
MFGIGPDIVSDIHRRKLWKSLPDDFEPSIRPISIRGLRGVGYPRGGTCTQAKLMDAQREEIRSRFRSQGKQHGMLTALAKEYGVGITTIHRIAQEVFSPTPVRRIIDALQPAKSAPALFSLGVALTNSSAWLDLASLPRELLAAYGYPEIERALDLVTKMASALDPAKAGMNAEEKAAFDQKAMMAALMAETGAAGEQEPQMPGPEIITEEDVFAVLDQMIQSGELTPNVAVEIMKAL